MKAQVAAFRRFHGVEPERVSTKRLWLPGELVLMGAALDTGYRVTTHESEKDYSQEYVHDHKDGVMLYRRARTGERPDKVMRPRTTCWLLGAWLGATYVDREGRRREVAGGKLRAISPTTRVLYVLGGDGVRYVITGGRFRITDWMYD